MRLLTGKKPLKDRLPKNKQTQEKTDSKPLEIVDKTATNLIAKYSK